MGFAHKPVLLAEVLGILNPRPGETFVDCTVGGGGHSLEIIKSIMPGGKLIAMDRDAEALKAAQEKLARYREAVAFVHKNFRHLKAVLESLGINAVDGILIDAGVSSHQLEEDERGFSFHAGDAPLDMRMDQNDPVSAADLVNSLEAGELARIIRDYGEELWASRIAEFIVARRKRLGLIKTTGELVEVIKDAIPARARRHGAHPARRTFQALRIAVNDELGALEAAVRDGLGCLAPGGRMAVITFHSLEDRIVKKAFRHAAAGCECPRDLPRCVCRSRPEVRLLTGKPLRASEEEVAQNPRARSARLRGVIKVLNKEEGE